MEQRFNITQSQKALLPVGSTINHLVLSDKKNSIQKIEPYFKAYTSSSLPLKNKKPLPFTIKNANSNNGFFFSYLIILFVFGFYYQKHHKGLKSILQSFYNNTVLFQELNDKSGAKGIVSLGMFLIGIINLSIFFFQIINMFSFSVYLFDFHKPGISILLINIVLITGLFVKIITILSSGVIFNSNKIIQAYLSIIITSIQITGIILFPIIILYTFNDLISSLTIIKTGITLIALIYLSQVLRAFFIGVKQTKCQIFHIFLYICAFEILPNLVLRQILLQYTG